jgi:hypothetical protein
MEVEMKEYRVTRDVSLKNDNNPLALEKIANEMAGEGWRLGTRQELGEASRAA